MTSLHPETAPCYPTRGKQVWFLLPVAVIANLNEVKQSHAGFWIAMARSASQ